MPYGITDQGWVTKRLDEIKTEIEQSIRTLLGPSINLLPTETIGQMIGIFSEREALLWELGGAIYDSQYPNTASGVNLDYVVSLTGIERLNSTFSKGEITAFGTAGTIIPQESIISVSGNPESRFETSSQETIQAGVDEVQLITFSAVPTSGSFSLIFNGEETGLINWNDLAINVQNALNALVGLSSVVVTGNFSLGFTVTFSGSDGQQDQPLIQEGNSNTLSDGSPISISFSETTQGELPSVNIPVVAENPGAVQALSGTLTVIETVIAGWDSVTNALDIIAGKEIESHAALRQRRELTLAFPGAATVNAIRSKILAIDEVIAALVFDNITLVTDSNGLPPKSIKAVVLGGDDQEIAEVIFGVAPAGIELFGTTTVVIQDSQGIDHDVNFSRPTEIPIYLEVDIKTNSTFPLGGEDFIKSNIVAFARERFSISDSVITTELYCPIHDVIGITGVHLRISTSNIPLVQKLTFDSDFVAGNIINGKIASIPISSVPFNTDHATTLSDLANEIQSNALISSAVVTGAREITVTSLNAGDPGPLNSFIVTGGVSQPLAYIETTSHSDGNISILIDEISTWDTSRIVVTKLV